LSRSERVGYRAPREQELIASRMPVSFTTSTAPGAPPSTRSDRVVVPRDTPGDIPGAPPSARSDRVVVSRVKTREKTPPASPTLVNFTPTEEAPTARPITAQRAPGSPASVSRSLGWKALGNGSKENPRAEGAPYNPALANQPSFFDGIDTSVAGLATLIPSAPREISIEITILDQELRQVLSWSQHESQRSGVPILLADTLNRLNGDLAMIEKAHLDPVGKATVLHELRIKRTQLNEAFALALG